MSVTMRPATSVTTQVILSVWRCPSCGAILARLSLTPGSVVEIKCRRCSVLAIRESA